MNSFDQKLKGCGQYPLKAKEITTLQVNVGYKCNLMCSHCHIEASPERVEMMSLPAVSQILDILRDHDEITTVDITGGSPELNPFFKYFVKSCADMGKKVIVRTNLAIFSEPGIEDVPEFLAENRVKIIASLPCYSEEGVDSQRGRGTYKKAMNAMKKLNALGFGNNSGLSIDIMFNPAKADIAPDQQTLEKAYKEKLKETQGITFNHLLALGNMPIGRLGKTLTEDDHREYMDKLREKFNPRTLENVMCRSLISISPEGKLYDCDFWQMLSLPVRSKSSDIGNFDYAVLSNREIVTNALCFMCTAGAGASCSGVLT